MGKQSVDERLDIISKSVTDLANVVLDVVNRVYKEGHEYGEEEEYEFNEVEKTEDLDGIHDPLKEDTEKMTPEEDVLAEEILEDEVEMSRKKGFNNTARKRANEEDAPFGEQQDSIKGNEPSPAGEIGGSREDETFNAKFSCALKDIEDLKSAKFAKAGAIVPGIGNVRKGREAGSDSTGRMNTVELQKAAKDMTYKQLNEFRMQQGLLPRNLFGG